MGLESVGPALTGAEILRFEESFGVEFPTDYRQFLLITNGGCPRKSRLAASNSGMKLEADVVRWFSIMGNTEPYPAGSLEGVVELSWSRNWPSELLPIAEVKPVGLSPPGPSEGAVCYLFLVMSGMKAGRVLMASPDALAPMFPNLRPVQASQLAVAMMQQLVDQAPIAGRNMGELLGNLRDPVPDIIPDWLQTIRDDDVEGFVEWVQAGGTSAVAFQDRGVRIPLSLVDYLTLEGSAKLLARALELKLVKPKHLRESWEKICHRDLRRFRVLMQVLPKDMWKFALISRQVWDDPALWEELKAAGVNFNQPVDDEGRTPIHLAVECGKPAAVKWLMQHGADPRKPDKYGRDAFTWTDRGPGYDCLVVLEGKENLAPPRDAQPDVEGIGQLLQASNQLANGVSLVIEIHIKSPPVTQVEKSLYQECHYRLSIDLQRRWVTFKDARSPRQDYLHADDWPAVLFLPIIQWPELVPQWDTLEVQEFDWNKALKVRKYQPLLRPDLVEAARQALQQSFNAEEAAARGIRIRK